VAEEPALASSCTTIRTGGPDAPDAPDEGDTMNTTDVIVGVDGSPHSWDALRWAAGEACRRGSMLRVVSAYRPPTLGEQIAAGIDLAGIALSRAESVVAEMVAQARWAWPGLRVNGLSVCGATVPVLLATAGRSALVVVGSRGHGGFASLLLGATGLQLATHAPVPVAVVRGRTDDTTGPVVVGSDGSAGSEEALELAFEEAALRHCGLVAVRAYRRPVQAWGPDVPPVEIHPERRPVVERAALDDSIARWREKYPQVPVETRVGEGEPAEVLVAASHDARLVVVGTRGHGGFAGLLLGSVGQHLLHHAECPVLIARTTRQ